MKHLRRQRGVALITVVFVITLATIIAMSLVTSQSIAISRTSNLLQRAQAGWYGAGLENWSAEILRLDKQDSEYDSLDEIWAFPVDYLPIDGGYVSGQLTDQHAKFNLNDLASPDSELVAEQLEKLLGFIVDPEPSEENQEPERIDDIDIPAVVQSITDWVDEDIDPKIPGGAEDDYYLGLDSPYRTANQPMSSISELRMVKGVSKELYQAMAAYVTAIAPGTQVNVNTASAEVLAALVPEMSPGNVQEIISIREETPFESVNDFMQSDPMAGRQVDDTRFTVNSEFFLLAAQVTVGTTQTNLYSLFHRDDTGQISVIGHSQHEY